MGRRVIIICSCLFNRTKGTRNFFLCYLDKKSTDFFFDFFPYRRTGRKICFFYRLDEKSNCLPFAKFIFRRTWWGLCIILH